MSPAINRALSDYIRQYRKQQFIERALNGQTDYPLTNDELSAMSMKLIDTSAWVEFLRKQGMPTIKQAVARLLQTNLAAYTCPIRSSLTVTCHDRHFDVMHAAIGDRLKVEQL